MSRRMAERKAHKDRAAWESIPPHIRKAQKICAYWSRRRPNWTPDMPPPVQWSHSHARNWHEDMTFLLGFPDPKIADVIAQAQAQTKNKS